MKHMLQTSYAQAEQNSNRLNVERIHVFTLCLSENLGSYTTPIIDALLVSAAVGWGERKFPL